MAQCNGPASEAVGIGGEGEGGGSLRQTADFALQTGLNI